MQTFLFFLMIVGLLACEKKDKFKHLESDSFKTESDQADFKKRLATLADENKILSVKWGNVSIFRGEQQFNSIFVDGSDLKWLMNSDKDIYFGSLHFVDSLDKGIYNQTETLEKFKQLNPPSQIPLLSNELLLSYEYKWALVLGTPKLYLVTYFEDKQNRVLKKMFRYGILAKQETVGSGFQDSQIRIFPNGPKLSVLTDINVRVSSNEPLSSDYLHVVSDADKTVEKVEPLMKFDVRDDRFDQIQVYYFLQKSLDFQKNTLGFQSPAVLKARVHVGFPENTNTTFYFKNEIRLGQGDDVYYSQLSRDPSIVFHESMHFLVDQVAGLPFQGEGGSINEGFADFYTAVALKKPTLGDSAYLKGPYKRNIANIVKYSEKNGGLYHDSAIVSSLLWQIKDALGESIALEISKDVLLRMNSSSDLVSFNTYLQKSASSKKDWEKIKNILKKSDFPMVVL